MATNRRPPDLNSHRKRAILKAAYEREGGRCFYCHLPLALLENGLLACPKGTYSGRRVATLDHIVTRSQGGRTRLENVVCACFQCNAERGDRAAYAFLAFKLQQKGVLRRTEE
jgi:5-methylcytosine-specific restriction endonuclease McrA